MEKVVISIWAEHKFSEEEKRKISMDLATKNLEKERLEDEKKTITSNFGAKINAATADINKLSQNLTSGSEHRYFKCFRTPDFKKKLVTYTDINTKKIVKIVPFEPDDYQRKFW